jgi:hypothetical protein
MMTILDTLTSGRRPMPFALASLAAGLFGMLILGLAD